jgi:hypothetical protein
MDDNNNKTQEFPLLIINYNLYITKVSKYAKEPGLHTV